MTEPLIARYGTHDSQFVEIWDPATEPRGSAVLIHGGYWRETYGLELMHPLAEHLRTQGWQVVNVEYRRLSADPNGNDGRLWDRMQADILSGVGLARPAVDSAGSADSAGPMVIIGHSAGGHLALWCGASSPIPGAVVALAPVADLTAADGGDLSGGVVRRLLGGDAGAVPERYLTASPIELVPLGLPQLIVHGDRDEDVPQQISVDYAAAAGAAGDPVELLTPAGADHFDVIDPAHAIWRTIDDRLLQWAAEGQLERTWPAGPY